MFNETYGDDCKDFAEMFGFDTFGEYLSWTVKKGKRIFDTFNPEIEGK